MSEAFYKTVRFIGRAVFRAASQPVILHAERTRQPGAFILAANHGSAFDPPLLIYAAARVIYWVSIVELFHNPFSRWFLTGMLAAPLDRSRVDSATMRTITRHLRAGRGVGVFPEGRLRGPTESVLAGGEIDNGVCRLAQLAKVPVMPCVVVGADRFAHWMNWLPLLRTRWSVAFGELIHANIALDKSAACAAMNQELRRAFADLREEIRHAVPDL